MAVCFAFKIAIRISTSKTTVYFLVLLMSSLQQNWRKGQNRFCLEARRVGGKGRCVEHWGKMSQTMYAHRSK
jgi:hypothetical protein